MDLNNKKKHLVIPHVSYEQHRELRDICNELGWAISSVRSPRVYTSESRSFVCFKNAKYLEIYGTGVVTSWYFNNRNECEIICFHRFKEEAHKLASINTKE